MAKKRDKKKREEEPELPKFGGFKPLAGGLEGIKAALDAETKKKAETQKASGGHASARPAPSLPRHAPAPPTRPTSSSTAAEDELSFHRMMAGVTPLDTGGRARIPLTADVLPGAQRARAAEARAQAGVEAEKALAHLHSLVDGVARFEVTDDGRRVEGRRTDTSPELVRSLRRGQLPIDARLDLHGLTAAQAQEKLAEFLRAMRTRGERCVLIIHGKGERSPEAGVLRGEIAAWLSQGRAREHVAAFATAHDEDGGEGAVYVALRR